MMKWMRREFHLAASVSGSWYRTCCLDVTRSGFSGTHGQNRSISDVITNAFPKYLLWKKRQTIQTPSFPTLKIRCLLYSNTNQWSEGWKKGWHAVRWDGLAYPPPAVSSEVLVGHFCPLWEEGGGIKIKPKLPCWRSKSFICLEIVICNSGLRVGTLPQPPRPPSASLLPPATNARSKCVLAEHLKRATKRTAINTLHAARPKRSIACPIPACGLPFL